MAGNDNILRAPASGFGQEVSFATSIDPRNTPQLDGVGRRGVSNGGVQGQPVAGAAPRMQYVEAPPADPTFLMLSKVAGSVLQGKIKQEQARAFVTGMQRAAAGEAIKDIAEGQPWYSRIFGDSDVVEGARVYTAQARAAEAAAAIEDDMVNVRQLGPEAANAYFSEMVAKHMTGDDATDAVLMQGFSRTLPASMRRQAKEHYAWKQEEASKAESSALLSAAELLQKRAGSDKQTENEYVQQAVQLIAGMRPAAGRDIESWTKARVSDITTLAQAGKFHAVNVIKASGMLSMLPTDARVKVESAIDTAENRTISTKSFEYADEIGAIAGQAEVYHDGLDPDGVRQQIAALNERFRRETGIDRDLLSLDKASGIIKDAHVTLLREGERRIRDAETKAATARDKLQEQAILESGAMQAISVGQAGAAKRQPKMSGVVDRQFLIAYRALAAQGPDAQAQMLYLNYTGGGTFDGYHSNDIKEMFERRLGAAIGAQMPGDWLQLAGEYEAMRKLDPTLADTYFGKYADRMATYTSMLREGPPGSRDEGMAFAYAFATEKPRPKAFTKDDRKEFGKALKGNHEDASMWSLWMSRRMPMREDQLNVAAYDLEGAASKYKSLPNVSMPEAARRAFAERQRDAAAEVLGGFYIVGARGQQSIASMLKTTQPGDNAVGTGSDYQDVWDNATAAVFSERAKKVGADFGGPITVIRMPDKDGVAYLHVLFTPKDGGQPVPALITSEDIRANAKAAHANGGNPYANLYAEWPDVPQAAKPRVPLTLGKLIESGDYTKGAAIARDDIARRNK